MAAVMKIIQSRRRGLPEGAILLENGKKVCEGVVCTPGVLVKVRMALIVVGRPVPKVLIGINLP